MSSLLERMLKASGKRSAELMSESDFFQTRKYINLGVPVLNMACSGKLDGGLSPGVTLLAGKSGVFKSVLGLLMMKAFMDEHPQGMALFYDSEFGTTPEYLKSVGIDPNRVIHIKVTDIEQMTFDMRQKLEAIEEKDDVFIFVDSIGNLASKKESADALEGKGAQDMTRARSLKSFFRIVTPFISIKSLYFVGVMHTYETMCLDENTRVIMADGDTKAMKDLIIGDQILSSTGTSEQVIATYGHEFLVQQFGDELELYELELEDGSIIQCSGNHRFMIDGDWVFVKDLISGQNIQTAG